MKKAPGFTLVELMVTVSIAAILLAVGLPAMQNFIKDNRITTVTNELVTATQLARTAAVQYATTATVCASRNQSGCNTTNWENGWMVWVDKDRDGARDSDETLQYFDAVPDGVEITSPGRRIRYDERGNATVGTGTFTICDDRTAETGRALAIWPIGRTQINRSHTCS